MVSQFWNPVRITFGPRSFERLPELLAPLSAQRIALIGDAHLLGELGLRERIRSLLPDRQLSIFDGFSPNPQVAEAQAAVRFVRDSGADVVLGIGGGSALDVAKVAAAVATIDHDLAALLASRQPVVEPGLPTVLVPTTAGTGSEVTRWATLWDHEAKRKHSLEGPGMYPTHALLDPELTLTLPPPLAAVTGADALSHAMEAYWNRGANAISDVYALEAVRRIFESLPMVVLNPDRLEYRTDLLFASLLAGLAFSNTKTAAAHSLSYPMTLHFGVAHGQATSITLPALLKYNAEASLDRMTQLAKAIGGNSIDSGARRIQVLLQRIGLKTTLADLGIDAEGIELCVREGYTPDRAGNNLRELDADGMREILRMVA